VVVIGELRIKFDTSTELHILKHGVSIIEVLEALRSKFYRVYIGKGDYLVIAKNPVSGRYLTIFLRRLGGNTYRLKTARDSTPSEKRLYRKKVSKI